MCAQIIVIQHICEVFRSFLGKHPKWEGGYNFIKTLCNYSISEYSTGPIRTKPRQRGETEQALATKRIILFKNVTAEHQQVYICKTASSTTLCGMCLQQRWGYGKDEL